MIITENVIEKIRHEAYQGVTSDMIEKRIRTLYTDAFSYLASENLKQATESIIEFEKSEFMENIKRLHLYSNPSLELILSEYSRIALFFAEKRMNNGKTYVIAECMSDALVDIAESNEKKFTNTESIRLISETILDFEYAAGVSDNMSFRMHTKK